MSLMWHWLIEMKIHKTSWGVRLCGSLKLCEKRVTTIDFKKYIKVVSVILLLFHVVSYWLINDFDSNFWKVPQHGSVQNKLKGIILIMTHLRFNSLFRKHHIILEMIWTITITNFYHSIAYIMYSCYRSCNISQNTYLIVHQCLELHTIEGTLIYRACFECTIK